MKFRNLACIEGGGSPSFKIMRKFILKNIVIQKFSKFSFILAQNGLSNSFKNSVYQCQIAKKSYKFFPP